jgi:ankyrin repeat protein
MFLVLSLACILYRTYKCTERAVDVTNYTQASPRPAVRRHFFCNISAMSSSSTSPGRKLLDACISGEIAAVRELLDDGGDVNWKDKFGDTALIWANVKGHAEVVKLLLERGAHIDHQSNIGVTALICASYNGKIDCARLLLERGSDISMKSENGKTAKDFALEKGKVNIVQLLDEVCIFQTQDK